MSSNVIYLNFMYSNEENDEGEAVKAMTVDERVEAHTCMLVHL